MSKMIQIRNVPESLHRELKARAARAGQSLSDFLLAELRRVAAKPTMKEVLDRIRSRPPVDLKGLSPAEIIREHRDA